MKCDKECIRKSTNWTHLQPYHKFDKPYFNLKKFSDDISISSPKLEILLNKINELDNIDMSEKGQKFKHMIFTDVRGGAGARIIAAGLLSRGYQFACDKKLRMLDDELLLRSEFKNFVLLCGTALYENKIGVKLQKSILKKFNTRPDNINGNYIRFIVLDNSYREGIDLFDIKYVHLFEPQINNANTTQAIGRSLRFCGQKGLDFIKNTGWKVFCFIYDVKTDNKLDTDTLFNLYMKYAGIDIKISKLIDSLKEISYLNSVDYQLTKNIHNSQLQNYKSTPRYGECKLKNHELMKIDIVLATLVWFAQERYDKIINTYSFWCKTLYGDTKFYNDYKNIILDPHTFIINNLSAINNAIHNKRHYILQKKNRVIIEQLLHNIINDKKANFISKKIKWDVKPGSTQNIKQFIKKNFMEFEWPRLPIQNMCNTKEISSEIIKFSPTQEFVRHWFTPDHKFKGLLLYHSVGTGKTCSAIATASTSFAPQGWTILWVTRSSLKQDIWKNHFDTICNIQILDKIKKGFKVPTDLMGRMKLLKNEWNIRPMSYKQFSNLISKKNSYYNDLVNRNGKIDPLQKTLLIIDEAHKLYGTSDLLSNERPDMDMFKKSLMKSYLTSGNNSVKLLLMTGTPITNDPMELTKLLNLMRNGNEQLPDNINDFSKNYLNEDLTFTSIGKKKFMDQTAGYISYLNREKDVRQFAQSAVSIILVPISENDKKTIDIKELKETYRKLKSSKDNMIKDCKKKKIVCNTDDIDDKIEQIKNNIKSQKSADLHDFSQMNIISRKCCHGGMNPP